MNRKGTGGRPFGWQAFQRGGDDFFGIESRCFQRCLLWQQSVLCRLQPGEALIEASQYISAKNEPH
jgi:hypothetical protein